jgi:hypothetical protein
VARDASVDDTRDASVDGALDAGMDGALDGGGMVSDAGAAADSVRIIRGDPMQAAYWDIVVVGEGLTAWNGKLVTMRVGIPEYDPERLGSGEVTIEQGAFELAFPSVWEEGIYKRRLLYVDLNDSGSCDASDAVFHDDRCSRGTLIVRMSNATMFYDLTKSSNVVEDCKLLNGPWPTD